MRIFIFFFQKPLDFFFKMCYTIFVNNRQGVSKMKKRVFAVFSNGDWEVEFPTRQEAEWYVKKLIKGTAEDYRHTQKWAREMLGLTIEEMEYEYTDYR